MKKLFLDDVRVPYDCRIYMSHRVGNKAEVYIMDGWSVVRSHNEFVDWVETNGLPDLVSFDHDLALGHYTGEMYSSESEYEKSIVGTEPTGYESAKFLIDYCLDKNLKLPDFIVHSMNPVGVERITKILTNFQKHQS